MIKRESFSSSFWHSQCAFTESFSPRRDESASHKREVVEFVIHTTRPTEKGKEREKGQDRVRIRIRLRPDKVR